MASTLSKFMQSEDVEKSVATTGQIPHLMCQVFQNVLTEFPLTSPDMIAQNKSKDQEVHIRLAHLEPTLGIIFLKIAHFRPFVTLLRVPYVRSGHVMGVFWGKI